MTVKILIVLCATIILAATFEAVAEDNRVPNIDLSKRCRASERATVEMMGISAREDAYDQCVKTETAAREQIIKVWDTVPAAAKALCAQPGVYSPSYVEWVTCGEMARDVAKSRKEQPAAVQTSKLCPIVRYQRDGSVTTVAACGVPTRRLN